ncbi:MAG TPA: hypothetical protein VME70_09925 [Mycobacteriales bacterium]|nr:hypothetical protein [Mycobacteriales bacterium]
MGPMKFHPWRLMISLAFLAGAFGLTVLAIMFAPGVLVKILVVAFISSLFIALIVCPQWVMQGDPAPPRPRGGGVPLDSGEPTDLGARRRARQREQQPGSNDLAARTIGTVATA